MNTDGVDLRLIRRLGYVGALALLFIAVAFFALNANEPGWAASGASIMAYYRQHNNMEHLQVYLIVGGLMTLVLYSAILHDALRALSGQRIWPKFALAGGVVFLAGSAIGGYSQVALMEGSKSNMPAAAAVAMNALQDAGPVAFQVGAAMLAIGTALVLLTRRGPYQKSLRWLGVYSLLTAVGAIWPFFLVLFVVWVPLTGWSLQRKAAEVILREEDTAADQPHIRLSAD